MNVNRSFNRKDRFFHKAKAEGFLARSAYKLDELQKKHRLFAVGDLVLDLGAAPGAWSQIAMKVVGPRGRVVGLDLKPISLKAPNAQFHVMNAFDFDPAILDAREVGCVLSDMAPNTSGVAMVDQAKSVELCHQVLNIGRDYLKTGGHLVLKIFEGPDVKEIDARLHELFSSVKRSKPEAVRKGSFETYFVGLGKR